MKSITFTRIALNSGSSRTTTAHCARRRSLKRLLRNKRRKSQIKEDSDRSSYYINLEKLYINNYLITLNYGLSCCSLIPKQTHKVILSTINFFIQALFFKLRVKHFHFPKHQLVAGAQLNGGIVAGGTRLFADLAGV
jgi:hypothetical protein